jgi:hypothetical protein
LARFDPPEAGLVRSDTASSPKPAADGLTAAVMPTKKVKFNQLVMEKSVWLSFGKNNRLGDRPGKTFLSAAPEKVSVNHTDLPST